MLFEPWYQTSKGKNKKNEGILENLFVKCKVGMKRKQDTICEKTKFDGNLGAAIIWAISLSVIK